MFAFEDLIAFNELLQNGKKSQAKKELGFDNLQKKTPTKKTFLYLVLIQLDNGGGKGVCGWAVNGR